MNIKGLIMKVSFVMLFAFLGHGCAAKKMALENADFLISHQIDKHLPLYSDQKKALNKDIDAFLNQLKPDAESFLPLIDEINLESKEKTAIHYKKLETIFRKISKKFTDLISKYLAKLDSKQQKDFFTKLDEENSKISKSKKDKNIETIEDRIEKLFGSTNPVQKELVKENIEYFDQRSIERLTRRVQLHQAFRSIYTMDISEESKTRLFQDAFTDYQTKSIASSKNQELLQKFISTLSEKQREHFKKEAKEIKNLLQYFLTLEY